MKNFIKPFPLDLSKFCLLGNRTVRAHLGPWMGFDLRELEFCVVWVHLSDLFPCRGSQHLNTDAAAM